MTIFLISFFLFLIAVLAMGVGLLLGREGIRGSCGGLNRIPGLKDACGACTATRCKRRGQDGAPGE